MVSKVHRAQVCRNKAGDLRVRYRSKDYPSLSAAGEAVMGGIACNGWRFWSLDEAQIAANAPKREKRAS